jgi:hypothetical protein
MITAIDTNIFLDILLPDAEHASRSRELIDKYHAAGQLIISETVFAELASQFSSEKILKEFLADTSIKLLHANEKALSLAGERWRVYSKTRKDKLQCPSCGKKTSCHCPECGESISFRQRIISDFLIGAHALIHAEVFLTRDRGFYKTYFKDLRMG